VLFAACTTTHSQNIWVSLNKNWNNLRLKVIMAVWNLPWKCGLSFMNFCEFSSRNDTCKHKYSNHFTMSCSTNAFSGKIMHQYKLAEAHPSLMFSAWTPGAHSSRHFVYVHLIFIYVWCPYLPSLFKSWYATSVMGCMWHTIAVCCVHCLMYCCSLCYPCLCGNWEPK